MSVQSEYTTNGKFDVAKFNTGFDTYIDKQKNINKTLEKQRLNKLNEQQIDKKNLLDNSLMDVLIGIKDSWFNLLDDLLQQKFSFDVFLKDSRGFYIGITLFFIAIFMYLFSFFNDDDDENKHDEPKVNVIKKYIIYQNSNPNPTNSNPVDQNTNINVDQNTNTNTNTNVDVDLVKKT